MATKPKTTTTTVADPWPRLTPDFDRGPGPRGSIGLVALSTDRACEAELPEYFRTVNVGHYVSRVPIATFVDTTALRSLEPKVVEAVELLVPGTQLDVVALGCTSGAVAIGLERLKQLIQIVRPNAVVTSPVEATVTALRVLKAESISVLTPYVDDVNVLMETHLVDEGFQVSSKGSFKLPGDPEMNRVSADSLFAAGLQVGGGPSDALFISCAGLRTGRVIHELEDALGKPVVTSIQALAWHCLRSIGISDPIQKRGILFRRH